MWQATLRKASRMIARDSKRMGSRPELCSHAVLRSGTRQCLGLVAAMWLAAAGDPGAGTQGMLALVVLVVAMAAIALNESRFVQAGRPRTGQLAGTPRRDSRHHSPRSAVQCSVLAGICVACLSSCADVSMPKYQRPDTPTKSSWSQQAATVSASDTITPEWWREFRDPYLDTLVSKAIAGNFDVKVLAARIDVAGAQIGEARAGALPTADVGAGVDIEKVTHQSVTKQYSVGSQLNWEIDIWGKVEKGVQAQKAEYHASEADWRAGYLTLVSDVSSTYFQILQFDEQIDQQQKTLDKNKQILAIYEAMSQNGLVPKTQVLRQKAEINQLTKDLLELNRSRALADNALATLLGVPAGEFKVPSGHLQERVQLPVVPSGLPSDLLERRPDVVAAEYRVLEAYDLVGQAKLAQLPSISLTGRGGTSSFALSDLLKSFTFGLLPSINIPLLDPSTKAHVKTTEAQTKLAEQQYRQTVVAAFEEVENALVNLDAHKKQRTELQQQVDHLGVVAAQIEAQLKEGLVSQLEVFETERSLLAAQLALLANHQQILADTVTLYKALGGGWPTVNVANASE
jgi:NodT family efflux transporter outer membrane factor (OMF) lipoprotein